jgi:uncharacterized protein YjbI with pentapeptide repeats
MIKITISFVIWILGIYIFLFASSLYVHVNESNIIANKANLLLPKLTRQNNLGLVEIAAVQNMKAKSEPFFLRPQTLFKSLFGDRQAVNQANLELRWAIENIKDNLYSSTLSKVDFSGANLSMATLLEADLSEANLERVNLKSANLIRTKLNFANLYGAKLNFANLYKSDLSNTILKGADLSGAANVICEQIKPAIIDESTRLPDYIYIGESSTSDFVCKNLLKDKAVDLGRMNLTKVNLSSAQLNNANLSNVNFMGANLIYANLKNANLSNANLKGVNLRQTTNITCEQIKSAVIDESTLFPDYIYMEGLSTCKNLKHGKGLDLKGANFSKRRLYQADLSEANLSNVNFMGANLNYANLKNANLSNSNLKGVNLHLTTNIACEQIKSAVIDESTLFPDYIYMEGLSTCENLKHGKGLDLKGVNFSKRGLSHADLSEANLSNVNFMGANLNYANLKNANLSNANLKGVNLRLTTNITCEQIKSAVIDESTLFPDYIYMEELSTCENLKHGKGLDLKGANFSQKELTYADLSEANLSNVNFMGTNLNYANLKNANLSNTNLKGVNLHLTTNIACEQIKSAVIDESTLFPDYIYMEGLSTCENLKHGKGLDLKGVNFSQKELTYADLSEANLSNVNFMGANLNYANLKNANLSNANLKGVNLHLTTNITCEQIKSAVIDESTLLPSYISLVGSPGHIVECKDVLKKN